MSTPTARGGGQLVRDFATGYLHTRVTAYPRGRYAWQRRPGPDRGSRLHLGSVGFRERATAAGRGSVRFALALPRPAADGTLTYITPGHRSAAALLSAPLTEQDSRQLLAVMTDCGRALQALHQQARPQELCAPAAGPARLQSWMDTAGGPRAAAVLHARMREHLGRERWERISQWCDEAVLPRNVSSLVTLHGGFGLGQIVLADPPAAGAAVLAGEDATSGPASFDIGWLLGELAEFHMLTQRAGTPTPLLARARERFLTGYGALPDPAAIARSAVLRLATHTHDFAAFVGWHPELLHYIRHLALLIDEEGASTLEVW